ncbi:DUF222 domain-containing protein [Microbispora sp. RL4-1S]|uniref:DUF222 domain-containing protein n=1 Tax=Microbispora oryzae TaxID=2806554 RepID=A0A941ARG7_9ACTN|nr:HNH endonuclease signature motif containing protein [Microbispora oryzae]MBP2706049.1 DUF222 domain-containing protein [Microbispora oryzae]
MGDTATGSVAAGQGDPIAQLERIAAQLAMTEPPESPTMCLINAEALVRVHDLVGSAMTALIHRAHVTGAGKAHGHASTCGWLRSTRPTTASDTDPASANPASTTAASTSATSITPGAAIGPGMTGAQASRWLRLATEVARLPLVRARYAARSLSGGAVDAITTVTAKLTDKQAAEAEPILVELADSATCAEVTKAGRYIREILDPGTLVEECEDDYASRFLLLRPSNTGGVEGEFRLPREAAARLREFMTAYARPKDRDDDRPLRVRQADAFAALLSEKVSTELLVMVRVESLPDDILTPTGTSTTGTSTTGTSTTGTSTTGTSTTGTSTGSHDLAADPPAGPSGMADATRAHRDGEAPPTANVGRDGPRRGRSNGNDPADADADAIVEAQAQAAGVRADACRTCGHAPDRLAPGLLVATGHLLPVSDVHRLARTSRLTRMVMDAKGQVLDMGRSVRLATPAQRKALLAQYATCYCQGCPIPADMAEVDHVHGWIDDGVTNLDLLAPACTFHNRDKFTHPDRYTTHRNPNGTWTLLHHPNRRRYERSSHEPGTHQRPG